MYVALLKDLTIDPHLEAFLPILFSLAYIGGYISVFNDEWCLYPSIQVHEIGHNLRLQHSGENGEGKYDDRIVKDGPVEAAVLKLAPYPRGYGQNELDRDREAFSEEEEAMANAIGMPILPATAVAPAE